MQKAKTVFFALEQRAAALGWGAAQRAQGFQGLPHPELSPDPEHPWWPRVFLLSQYSAQVRLLHALLENDAEVPAHLAGNFVAQTVDKCQGDEADGVVLSLVLTYRHRTAGSTAARPVLSKHSTRTAEDIIATDFMQYKNRVNVAISRTRYMLVVVSSTSIVDSFKVAGRSTTWAEVLDQQYKPSSGAAQAAWVFKHATSWSGEVRCREASAQTEPVSQGVS